MRLTKLALATAVAAVALGSAQVAFAQRNSGVSALVVNYARIADQSALGRDMNTKLQGIGNQIQQQAQAMQSEEQSIQQEQQRLATATRGMTDAQIQANTTIRPQIEALRTRMQTFQQRRNALQGDAQCTQIISLRDFQNQVNPVVRTIMQQRGAGIVVDANTTQVFDPNADITNVVIQQLDQGTRTATVARHAVAECQQAGQAAAAPARR